MTQLLSSVGQSGQNTPVVPGAPTGEHPFTLATAENAGPLMQRLVQAKNHATEAKSQPSPADDQAMQAMLAMLLSQTTAPDAAKGVQAAPVPTTLTWLDFQAGYEKAVAENKILLVDAYTDWCYWCKVMDRETFSDTAVIRLLNTHFVTVKFNPEKNGKFSFNDTTMDNAQLYRWLGYGNIYGFPTTYFWIRPGQSEERHSLAGYNEPKEFICILDKVIAKKGGK